MNRLKHVVVFIGGLLFGFGLAFGGMSKPEIVLSFLQLKDLGLLLLLGGSAFVTAVTINLIPKILKTPLLGGTFRKRTRTLNKRTIIGATIFGIGWGISGQCPGSAMANRFQDPDGHNWRYQYARQQNGGFGAFLSDQVIKGRSP